MFECKGGALTLRDPDAWILLHFACCWQHTPSRTIFEIEIDPDAPGDAPLRLDHMRARLVHHCGTKPLPGAAELTRLGNEAVLMCLSELGIVRIGDAPGEMTLLGQAE